MSVESLASHERAVEQVVAAGGTVSAEHERIAESWRTLAGFGEPAAVEEAREALADAVIAGRGDVVELAVRYLAMSSGPMQAAAVRNAVSASVLAALRSEYRRSTAAANVGLLAGRFDAAGRELAAAMAVTEVLSPPERAIALDGDERRAWFAARTAAVTLDEVAMPLRTAAWLAGEHKGFGLVDFGGLDVSVGSWLGLLVDRAGANPRRLWEAWTGRRDDNGAVTLASARAEATETVGIGRWAGLVRAGAVLRFAGPEEYRSVVEPADYRVIQLRGGHGWVQVYVDPYDDRETQIAALMVAPGVTRSDALQRLDGVPCAA